ncbi:MAG TPA: SulP family inorganic anion transporter [Bacteroidia bacterium]|nr:SulP family inorganic anion transporter [Bacteroidia bacterium]
MFSTIKNDFKAGLVVFLVALPLCLGIALSQGAPLFSGIISGVIGGIVVASISKSKLSVSGPAAGLTTIVLASILSLGSFPAFLMALCLAGILQIIFGIIKAGIIGYYIPSAVIKGMLAAIGIILIIKQIPHFTGFDSDPEGDEVFLQTDGQNSFSELLNMANFISYPAMLIGVISILILTVYQFKSVKENKILSKIPSALLVVVIAILVNVFLNAFTPAFVVKPEHMVNLPVINNLSDLQRSFFHPDINALTNPKVYEVAFVIAIVASLETLLNIEAIDKIDPSNNKTPTNRELIAQGAGNLVAGLLGGIPITSVIVRSAANVSAGAKSQMSSIIHGIIFILTVLLIPGIIQLIPLSALASILIFTGYKLTSPKIIKSVFKMGYDQAIPFIVTIVVMLLTDLLKGVSCGIIVAALFILRNNYRFPFKMIHEKIEGRIHYYIKLSQNVTFLNKGKMMAALQTIPNGAKVYIDGNNATFIDKDILELLSEFKKAAINKNIEVVAENIKEVKLISE